MKGSGLDFLLQEQESPKYHRLSLLDICDEVTIDLMLNFVVEVSNLPVYVQEPMGKEEFFASKSPSKPEFCLWLTKDQNHQKKCKKFFTENVHKSATYGRPYVGFCPFGIGFAFGPLILKRGACTAALVAGYFRSNDDQDKSKLLVELFNDNSGTDDIDYQKLYHEIPLIDSIRQHAIADFLCTISAFFMKLVPLRQKNFDDFLNSDMAVARNLIYDFYKEKNNQDKELQKLKFDGNEEAKLIQAVSLGRRSVAEILLRDILDKLLVLYKENSIALKGHIMELAVLISRAPLFQVSYSEGEAFSLNHLPALNPPKTTSYLLLKNWVLTVLYQSLDIIERKQKFDVKAKVIREALTFINSNLHVAIRVEDIAVAVSFSPQHLSRIFRDEMGMTINQYVNQARIEEAKRLLRTTNYNISQISERLNYFDSTYFAKVFKKNTGLSPLLYKHNYEKKSE